MVILYLIWLCKSNLKWIGIAIACINLLTINLGQLAEGDLLLKANGIDLQGISSDK